MVWYVLYETGPTAMKMEFVDDRDHALDLAGRLIEQKTKVLKLVDPNDPAAKIEGTAIRQLCSRR